MRLKFYHIIFSCILLSFVACETEVDLFADEAGEVPVVFALLEPAADTQFFRINPTFIGEGDARKVAGNKELTNYEKGEIDVKLVDLTSDVEYVLKDSIGLRDLDDDGIFNKENRIYYLPTPVIVNYDTFTGNVEYINQILLADHEYQLWIKNNKNGKISTSTIVLGDIANLRMESPLRGVSQFPKDWFNFYTGSQYNEKYTFEFAADAYSERVLLTFRYYYTEGAEDPNSKDRYIQFNIGETDELVSNGFSRLGSLVFNGERFYSILNNQLDPKSDRTGQTADLILTAAGPDLSTYIRVQNATLTGISQENPSYTNITNGLGVFSYRLIKPHREFKLNEASAKWLFNGPLTSDRFVCARHGTQSNSTGVTPCR